MASQRGWTRSRSATRRVVVRSVHAAGMHLLMACNGGHMLHSHLRLTGSSFVDPPRSPGRGVVVLRAPRAPASGRRATVVALLDQADLDGAVARLALVAVTVTAISDATLDQREACGIGT
jgi:formamidopyrimidine-DNA glycosylase